MGGGMTHDDIIRMAREAGKAEGLETVIFHPVLERFANLVAAAERERLSWDSIHTCHAECQRPVCRLTRERDALLEALKLAADFLEHSTEFRLGHPGFEQAQAKARAAIKAVEGENT